NIHNIEFVYGIGLKDRLSEVGIKGINLSDIHEDILFDRSWNSNDISRRCLPNLKGKYIPYFKHLSRAGFLVNGKIPDGIDVPEFTSEFIKVVNSVSLERFYPSEQYLRHKDDVNMKFNSLDELLKANTDFHRLVYIPILQPEKINLESLEGYLKEKKDLVRD